MQKQTQTCTVLTSLCAGEEAPPQSGSQARLFVLKSIGWSSVDTSACQDGWTGTHLLDRSPWQPPQHTALQRGQTSEWAQLLLLSVIIHKKKNQSITVFSLCFVAAQIQEEKFHLKLCFWQIVVRNEQVCNLPPEHCLRFTFPLLLPAELCHSKLSDPRATGFVQTLNTF